MWIKKILPVFLWILVLLVGNYQIVSTTLQKIEIYHTSPPFRIGSQTNTKNLLYLLDSDLHTIWERSVKRGNEPDFFLEMKLTHFWNGESFVPFPIKSIEWTACPGKKLPKFLAKVFFRESINVDKELRMPKDTLISSFAFSDVSETKVSFNLSGLEKLKIENHYPEGISIYTLEMTLMDPLTPNDCFSEIQLKE